jgi:hypothetical protein
VHICFRLGYDIKYFGRTLFESSLPQSQSLQNISFIISTVDALCVYCDNIQQGNSHFQAIVDGELTFVKGAASAWAGGAIGGK